MDDRHRLRRRVTTPSRVGVREYGRDSLLIWANLLLAPLFSALGLRVGLQSDERLATRIEGDAAAMRKQGYLVRSAESSSAGWAPRVVCIWCSTSFGPILRPVTGGAGTQPTP